MAYEVTIESGEEVAANITLDLSKTAQLFCFAVTNRALYLPRIKLIAKTDPYYFQRVALDQVRHIAVKRLRPYGLWVMAGVMVIVGFFTTVWMMEPVLRGTPGKHEISGWPIAIFVCSFLVPYAAKGRFGGALE